MVEAKTARMRSFLLDIIGKYVKTHTRRKRKARIARLPDRYGGFGRFQTQNDTHATTGHHWGLGRACSGASAGPKTPTYNQMTPHDHPTAPKPLRAAPALHKRAPWHAPIHRERAAAARAVAARAAARAAATATATAAATAAAARVAATEVGVEGGDEGSGGKGGGGGEPASNIIARTEATRQYMQRARRGSGPAGRV
jgi:hypothetical protein